MKIIIVFLFILLISGIYAFCEEGQIDINKASVTELDELYGVGPATAQNIIDARPYEKIDDLINAKGIGEIKLSQIKNQGIACVGESSNSNTNENKKDNEDGIDVNVVVKEPEETDVEKSPMVTGSAVQETLKPAQVINLNAKDIKSEDDTQSGSKTIYYLAGFALLLGGLFLLRGKKQKTEFDD